MRLQGKFGLIWSIVILKEIIWGLWPRSNRYWTNSTKRLDLNYSYSQGNSLGTMAEVEKKFKKFDKNEDGKISRNELKDVLHALGSRTTSNEVSRIMSEIDKDDDSFISFDEFAEFHMRGLTSFESSKIYELQK